MKMWLLAVSCLSLGYLYGYNEFHINIFKQKVAQGEEGINCSNTDFRGSDTLLQGVSMKGHNFTVASFASCDNSVTTLGSVCKKGARSDLTGVDFSDATLVAADFKNAILKNVNFSGADIDQATFAGADLTNAQLDGVLNSDTAIFCGAIMPDGKKCSKGLWKSPSGKLFKCYCAAGK